MSNLILPDFKPLDTSIIGELPLLFQAARKSKADEELKRQNAATQKAYADNEGRKISNQEARNRYDIARQTKLDKEHDDQQAAAQLVPGSDFRRAVDAGDPAAGTIGEAWGIHQAQDTPGREWTVAPRQWSTTGSPPVRPDTTNSIAPAGDDGTPEAEAANFLLNGASAAPKSGKALLREIPDYGPGSADAGADTSTDAGPTINADAELAARPGAAVGAGSPPAASPSATTMPFFATVNGQRFEIPKSPPAHSFPEQEYNDLVEQRVRGGDSREKAEAQVSAIRGQNLGAAGRSATLGQKQATQLTREEQLAAKAAGLAQSGENSRGRDEAIVTAAGLRQSGMPELTKEQGMAMNALNQRASQLRQVTAWNKLIEADKTAEMLAQDVESGAVPLQKREAQVLAAKIIRGRVTDTEMRQLYDNIGGASDAFQRLAHNTGLGDMTPEQTRQLERATAVILNTHHMARDRAKLAIKTAFGPRTFGQMPEQAQQMADMFYAEIGAAPEDLFAGATGGIQPGAPHRPHVTPGAPGAPPAAPAAPPSGGMTDAQAVQLAQQRYAKNPNDAVAAAVLKAHGLLK